ncbi:MAG: single-stranded DNA-binding protein [Verrucomicrobiota bacterium]|nr:single-stranded DNA-binding protein [Verrucomicrobiota bacterium]
MASFNKVILMGNLTRDPETRVTTTGLTICKFGLAVNRVFTTKDGVRKEETTFVDVDAFDKQAEVITKYVHKGDPLFIEGRLKFEQWEANDGQKRSKLVVYLEKFEFISNRSENNSSDGSSYSGGYEQSSPPKRQVIAEKPAVSEDFSADEDTLDEEVPF